MTQLKRAARYLKGVSRKKNCKDPSEAHLEVHVDSDWAGDTARRRSTFGVIARRGRHLLRHSATVQNVIGLSSAESEYYALTKEGCSGLGPEATTFIAHRLFKREGSCIAKRSWQSTRHIQTRMLWLQERVVAKHLRVVKSCNGIKSCRHVDEST